MTTSTPPADRTHAPPTGPLQPVIEPTFDDFYRHVFLPEHRHPLNVALHIVGTIAGWAYVFAVLRMPWPWWPAVLLVPVVHAGPGLIGHRLLERCGVVGDARWRRTDFPRRWFILANHRLTAERLLWRRGRTTPVSPQGRSPGRSSPR